MWAWRTFAAAAAAALIAGHALAAPPPVAITPPASAATLAGDVTGTVGANTVGTVKGGSNPATTSGALTDGNCPKFSGTAGAMVDSGAACGTGTVGPGGTSGQLQYNNAGSFGGATGFSFSSPAGVNTLIGSDGGFWNPNGITLGSGKKLDVLGGAVVSNTTSLIFTPSCEGSSWMIGPDFSAYCGHSSGAHDNIGVGTIVYQALTSGSRNTAMGSENNRNLTTGTDNTSIGFEAGHFITTGASNTAIGDEAINQLTTGANNVGVGISAGTGLSGAASSNVCIFSVCGAANTLTGSNNVMVGDGNNTLTSGARNLFLGPTSSQQGHGIITGNGNVYIGGGTGTMTDQSDSITVADGDANLLSQYTTAQGYLKFFHPIEPTFIASNAGLNGTPFSTSNIGTGGTAACATSHVCDPISGEITVATGTSVSGNAQVTVNMSVTARTNIPNCFVSRFQLNSTTLVDATWTETTGTLTINAVAALASSSTYTVRYYCGGI